MNEKRNKRGGISRCPLPFMHLFYFMRPFLPTFYLRIWRVRSGYFLGVGSLIW